AQMVKVGNPLRPTPYSHDLDTPVAPKPGGSGGWTSPADLRPHSRGFGTAEVHSGVVTAGMFEWLRPRLPREWTKSYLEELTKDVPEPQRELAQDQIIRAAQQLPISFRNLSLERHVSVYRGEHGPVFLVSSMFMGRRIMNERIVGPTPNY